MTACPCLPTEIVPYRTTDLSTAYNLDDGSLRVADPCVGCMHSTTGQSRLVVALPCRRANTLHLAHLCVCTSDDCDKYARDSVNDYAQREWLGLAEVAGRAPCPADHLDAIRERLCSRFETNPARVCVSCGTVPWRLKTDATGAWPVSRCGGCLRVWYCSVDCQRAHRATHRADCVQGSRAPEFSVHVPADVVQCKSAAAVLVAVGVLHNHEGVCAYSECMTHLVEGSRLERTVEVQNGETTLTLHFCSGSCKVEALSPITV